jgi:hypothetical protein
MNFILIAMAILLVTMPLIACSQSQPVLVIQTQIPGNQTLLVEHECSLAACGTFIQTSETQ